MLKEFIQHIQQTTQPLVREVEGSTFVIGSNGEASELRPADDHPLILGLNSLDALVKLVQTEAATVAAPLYITIPTHKNVRCFGQPDPEDRFFRQVYYEVDAADVPGFQEGFRELEKAIIELRSRFVPNEGTEYLLDLLSRVRKENGVSSDDNGVSQRVEITRGITLKSFEAVRPYITLRPYRTFQEVEQPASEFILRLNNGGDVGLFEADGGMWRLAARQTIKAFLEDKLADMVAANSVYIAL